jgi:hypothetical protein
MSNKVKDFFKVIKTKHYKSSAYHPQGDGLSKRTIQTLLQKLRMLVFEDFNLIVPFFELIVNPTIAVNNRPSAVTGLSPIKIMQEHLKIINSKEESEVVSEAMSNGKRYNERLTKRLNEKRKEFEIKVRNWVLINKKAWQKDRIPKLETKFVGLFMVIEKINKRVVRLDL